MIEAEVHSSLRGFLRTSGDDRWPHHLTMARLVARALRLGRDALIQTGVFPASEERYALSYLMPVLLWSGGAIAVASDSVRKRLLSVEIPQLQAWLGSEKPAIEGDRWPGEGFNGLLLTSPQAWLDDRLGGVERFPLDIPTIVDEADDWERWAREYLTVCVRPRDWTAWMAADVGFANTIRAVRVQLTKSIFDRPENPYGGSLLDADERGWLREIATDGENVPPVWRRFWQQLRSKQCFVWAAIDRTNGTFSLYCSPAEVADALSLAWKQQPTAIVGGALGVDRDALAYRQRLGLGDLTCVKFTPDRQYSFVHLYAPDGLPFPNTPQFRDALLEELHTLIRISSTSGDVSDDDLIAILIGDVPLRSIVGATLAAEFGSRVRVDAPPNQPRGILVVGWEFWRDRQGEFPPPKLLVIATLPFPSLEDPLVAGRVAYYKQLRKDWFRLYLLPTALSELQRSIASVRNGRGVVALLDVRAIYRSYGEQIFSALSPYARVSSPEAGLFET